MKIGIAVDCTVCGQQKAPVGRSAPMGSLYCTSDCRGYYLDPQVGSLWPRETEEDFGYPVQKAGTREANLREKLAKLMPKKPDPPDDGSAMLRFDPQPIRRSAEAFAHALDYELPVDERELIDLLWVFGEVLDGHMESRNKSTMKLVDDLLARQIHPTTWFGKKSE
jgi:hypothetical protein